MPDEHSAEDEALNQLLGETIGGRYRIDELLGEGAMGAVFKATQLGLERVVAIKVLRPRYTDEPMVAKRFDREAMAASKLDHRNCIQVLDAGTTEDRLKYIVMEHLQGEELRALLDGPFEVARAVDLTCQILSGLEHAHRRGMVHRDLKPENVFVVRDDDEAEVVKLVDFGIVKLLDAGDNHERLTRLGMVFGTPAYMSPEQAAGGTIDERTDLYAVGVLLYEMLAGNPPFQADAPGILLRMQMISEPPPLPDSVPEPVRAVVARLLAKPARDRFESARQARAALEQALAPTRAPRRGIVFLPAISDAEPEPAEPSRPRRETQRGAPSLAADDEPAPSSTSMSGRSATMFAEHVPVAPPVDPMPATDSGALNSGVFGTVRAMPSVSTPAKTSGGTGKTIAVVIVVVAVLAFVMLAASGAFGASPREHAAAPRGGDHDG